MEKMKERKSEDMSKGKSCTKYLKMNIEHPKEKQNEQISKMPVPGRMSTEMSKYARPYVGKNVKNMLGKIKRKYARKNVENYVNKK